MRRKDISFEFTNINSKLIEEAAEYRSSNKKLVRVLALAACIAVLVTAIPLSLIMNREEATDNSQDNSYTTDDPSNETNDTYQIVYCSSESLEDLKAAASKNKDSIKFLPEEERISFDMIFASNSDWSYDRPEDAPQEIIYSIQGIEYKFEFYGAYTTKAINSNNEKIKNDLGYIAEYECKYYAPDRTGMNVLKTITCEYLYKIDEVIGFIFDDYTNTPKTDSEFTVEDAVSASKQELANWIGEERANEYTEVRTQIRDYDGTYAISLSKNKFGYHFSGFSFTYTQEGYLFAYSGSSTFAENYYNSSLLRLSEERVQGIYSNAWKLIEDHAKMINRTFAVVKTSWDLDINGDLYLVVKYQQSMNGHLQGVICDICYKVPEIIAEENI